MSILRQILDEVHHGSTEAAIQHELRTSRRVTPYDLAIRDGRRVNLSVIEAVARHAPQPQGRP